MERLGDSCCVRVVRPLWEGDSDKEGGDGKYSIAWFADVGVEASDNPVIGVPANDGDSSEGCSLISKSSYEGRVDDLSSQKSYK